MRRILVAALLGLGAFSSLAGCGASGPVFRSSPVPAGEAVIYVYRPSRALGAADSRYLWFDLQSTDRQLRNGGYYAKQVEPGSVSVWLNPGLADMRTTINARAGKTYYVRFVVAFEKSRLELVPEDEALPEIRECRLVE